MVAFTNNDAKTLSLIVKNQKLQVKPGETVELHDGEPTTLSTDPIERSAVELRLSPLNWPIGIDSNSLADGAVYFSNAIQEATEVYSDFDRICAGNASDKRLSPAGVHEANAAWATKNLPRLYARLAEVRRRAKRFEADRGKAVMEMLGAPPTNDEEISILKETRDWLRRMPEEARTAQIFALSEKGDRVALRAVLVAPAYLTGVNQEQIALLRDEVFRKANPARDEKHQLYRKAITVADRAVEGVIRFIEHEINPNTHARKRALGVAN